MLTKALAAGVLGLSLAAIPAYAQTTQTPPKNNQASTKSEQPHQTASQMNLWPATKIKGLNVYNGQNEKIGDISDLMLNKEGKIDDVVISVGGFLGIGTHDVAVKFSDLKWEMEPVKSTSTSSNAPAGGGTTNRPSGTVGTASSSSSSSSQPKQFWPDHAVLANASKDQLKNMPQFDSTK